MQRIPFDIESYRKHMETLLKDQPKAPLFYEALDFACTAHMDQWRKSGDAYILHPCSVARIMAEEMDITDPEILSAALLHDTVEDVEEITAEIVGGKFGSYVQAIVEGCTKVTHISGDKQYISQKTHRKIFSGAALRPEVMLVKLADRMHNLRTLQALPKRKRQRIADETIDIYAPLATVFGLFNMKREMYNLALLFKFPKQGAKVNAHIRQLAHEPLIHEIVEALKKKTAEYGLPCTISPRVKELWAYYDSMNRILLERIDTPIEIHLIAENRQACYQALGIINEVYQPLPRTLRDFIAIPKNTGYQSLHARSIIHGKKILFKMRTEEMARKAQRGLFRNWSSKSGVQMSFIKEIQELFDVLSSDDALSYREMIAASGKKEIYTYTPRGDLVSLPYKSTVLDFAFRVHTEIGKTCKGAVIRNKRFQANHILSDGDMVRIIRAEEPIKFEQDIMSTCQTPRARAELSKDFRIRRRKVTREVGQSMVRQEMLRYGFSLDVLEGESGTTLLAAFRLDTIDELYGRIGEGRLRLHDVMERIKNDLYGGFSPLFTPTGAFNKVELTTIDPVCVKLSSCCKPNPTAKDNCALLTEKGLSVHHKKCSRLQQINFQRDDAVNITWKMRETKVSKAQELHFLEASREEVMRVLSRAPAELSITSIDVQVYDPAAPPSWLLRFEVPNLFALQKALRHLDKSGLHYDFFLDC